MAVVTMRQLLESGVHFGHQTRRWNPKMKRFIFTERNGIYIIDLRQTLDYIEKAYSFIRTTVADGGSILFVGTKKQAQEAIAEQAARVGMPYVNHRWLGGMLTNFQTVYKRLQRMKELESIEQTGQAQGFTKKETLQLSREKIKLTRTLGGLRDMQRPPAAVWIVDTKKEHIAVDEARKLGIPVIAVLDTNCDPDEVDFPIPGNDDAIRSAALLTRVVADAVADGLIARSGKGRRGDEKPEGGAVGVDEPLAEWERELLQGSDAAPTEAAGSAAAPTEAAGSAAAAPAEAAGSADAAPATPAETTQA
ncbi:30S ribosomal protein S2 [Planosporangium mesophilum]|uniref:Small ribosomal subunit protein uS2 n=1 Tax=Planosporangium mesophilum TaxID=689768 RepID=A0A8J3T669_9ACTN|nr:30S ribosomal protein S2 [Planosporangium mesophilum]NJC81705.1 30S ribosomal protein S2 [Planosporangium mesophilum]GII20634.1 30S ribosomal protein S2 [Planosporangium mesophilum]